MDLMAERLPQEASAPYGDVIAVPVRPVPHAPLGGPDVARGRALIAGPGQGITYRMNTWHHRLTMLDRPGRFAMFKWLDGSSGDQEFVPVTLSPSA